MRRGLVAFGTLTLVGLGLTACGIMRYEQREPWRSEAEEACLSSGQVRPSAAVVRAAKIDGPGACGMDYPFKVAAFANGGVGLRKPTTLACPIIPRIDTWLEEVVRPAATLYFGVPVRDLRAGSYACRPRNNRSGAKLSEHSFGNALDVMAFVLADGREVTVLKGWRGAPAEQEFLREVFVGACRYFTTVLGPGADAFHYDHLHIDLARHDPRGERAICKPLLKFSPRLGVPSGAPLTPRRAPIELPPVELEQEGPYDERDYSSRGPAGEPPGAYALAAARPAPPYPPQAAPPRRDLLQAYPRPDPPPFEPRTAGLPPAPVGAPRRAVVAAAPGGFTADLPAPPRGPAGEPPPGPLYTRPPVPGQVPQWLNGHGLY
jgi:Extensin-like protein C-terminus